MDDICPTMDWFTVTRSCINLLDFILFESILETSDSVQGQIICKLMGILFWTELSKKETNDVYDVEWEKKLLNANQGVVNNKK